MTWKRKKGERVRKQVVEILEKLRVSPMSKWEQFHVEIGPFAAVSSSGFGWLLYCDGKNVTGDYGMPEIVEILQLMRSRAEDRRNDEKDNAVLEHLKRFEPKETELGGSRVFRTEGIENDKL